jgi:hypothetical protein
MDYTKEEQLTKIKLGFEENLHVKINVDLEPIVIHQLIALLRHFCMDLQSFEGNTT